MRRRRFITGAAATAAGVALGAIPGASRILEGGRDADAVYVGGEKVWPVKPPFSPLDLNPIAWWPFDGDLTDVTGNFNFITTSGTPVFDAGGVNGMFARYGTILCSNNSFLQASMSPSNREVSMCWWSRMRSLNSPIILESLAYGSMSLLLAGHLLRVVRYSGVTNNANNRASVWVVAGNAPESILSFDAVSTPMNAWTHFSVVAGEKAGSDFLGRLYVNGEQFESVILNASFVQTQLQSSYFSNSNCDWCDLMIIRRALTAAEVKAVYEWRK